MKERERMWRDIEARERATMGGSTFDQRMSKRERPVEGIELRNPPFPIRMFIMQRHDGDVLMFECNVPHRDSGERIMVAHTFPVPNAKHYLGSFRDYVFDCLRRVFDHEAHECFFVDGERVHDPHRDDEVSK